MGTACTATDLTPGLGFSHRCGSKVNSVKRVKEVLGSLWSLPSFHCTFVATVWNPWAQPCYDIIPFLNTNFWKRLMYQQYPSEEGYVGYPLPSWLCFFGNCGSRPCGLFRCEHPPGGRMVLDPWGLKLQEYVEERGGEAAGAATTAPVERCSLLNRGLIFCSFCPW